MIKTGSNKHTKNMVRHLVARPGGRYDVVELKPKKRPARHGVTKLVGKGDAKVIRRSGGGTVVEQRVYGANGRLQTVYTIDSGSGTFGSDLGYAFKKNVAKARRENKKRFGTTDAIIPKG